MISAWRIVSANYKDKAYAGDGARIYGGRWNSKGVAVVYTAGSLALASIEMIVNLPAPKLLQKYVRISARISLDLVFYLSDFCPSLDFWRVDRFRSLWFGPSWRHSYCHDVW